MCDYPCGLSRSVFIGRKARKLVMFAIAVISSTTRECAVVMFLVASVCLSVCRSVCLSVCSL